MFQSHVAKGDSEKTTCQKRCQCLSIWTSCKKLNAFQQSKLANVKEKKIKLVFPFHTEFLLYDKGLRVISFSHKIIPARIHFSCGNSKQCLEMLICQRLAQCVLVSS